MLELNINNKIFKIPTKPIKPEHSNLIVELQELQKLYEASELLYNNNKNKLDKKKQEVDYILSKHYDYNPLIHVTSAFDKELNEIGFIPKDPNELKKYEVIVNSNDQ